MVGTAVIPLPDGWMLPGYDHIQKLGSGAERARLAGAASRDRNDGRREVLLVPSLHASADFRQAYRTEAVLLAALDSPHITRLYEYVEGPPGAAIVMEAVEGCSLRDLLKQEQEAATPEAALCILKGSLLGLAAAHEAGVVHRDYKPANVLVTSTGMSKLVDFGIAARAGERPEAAGTPLYMAPEQFHGAPASPEADVWRGNGDLLRVRDRGTAFPGCERRRANGAAHAGFHPRRPRAPAGQAAHSRWDGQSPAEQAALGARVPRRTRSGGRRGVWRGLGGARAAEACDAGGATSVAVARGHVAGRPGEYDLCRDDGARFRFRFRFRVPVPARALALALAE